MIDKKIPAQASAKRQNKGFTLTEIAIVLGIMGLILGAIWVAASGVYANQRVNSANTAVMQIAQGVRALYATSSNMGNVAVSNQTNALITANAVPRNLVSGSGATAFLAGPLPGGFTAIEANGDGNGFVIVMSGASRSVCITLLTAVGGTSRDPGLTEASAVAATPFTTGAASLTHTAYADATTPAALAAAVTPATAALAEAANIGGCTSATANHALRFGFTLK